MATLTQNQDGTLTLTLSVVERDTLDGLPAGQLEDYLTLWLHERATQVFQQRFAKLSPQDQGEVLVKFREAGKPVAVKPPEPPVVEPPIVPPVVEPPVTPPIIEPPVSPPVVEPPIVQPPLVDPPIPDPPVVPAVKP